MGLRPWHYMHVIESFVAKKREKNSRGGLLTIFFSESKSLVVVRKVSQSVTTYQQTFFCTQQDLFLVALASNLIRICIQQVAKTFMTSEGHTLLLISYENDTLQNVQLVFCKRLAINARMAIAKQTFWNTLNSLELQGFQANFSTIFSTLKNWRKKLKMLRLVGLRPPSLRFR